MTRMGVIGYGYWGPNLARNFAESSRTELVAIADRDAGRREAAKGRHPSAEIVVEASELIGNPAIDAVAIATPVRSHFDLALAALEAGKHVWVEKPFTESAADGARLVAEAEQRGLTLLVDHTFIYTAAVRKIRELVNSGQLGNLYYYDSVRVNLGLFQPDVNVLYDLAVHDLSIMDFIVGKRPHTVSATGSSHVEGRPENIAYLTCFFDDGLVAHIHVNWLSPVKIRQTLIGGDRQMIVYDDLEPSEKIKVYDCGITVDQSPEDAYYQRIGYRSGDMFAPKLKPLEALRIETEHFAECIENKTTPLTDGRSGLRVIKILEAANRSLAKNGAPVGLEWD